MKSSIIMILFLTIIGNGGSDIQKDQETKMYRQKFFPRCSVRFKDEFEAKSAAENCLNGTNSLTVFPLGMNEEPIDDGFHFCFLKSVNLNSRSNLGGLETIHIWGVAARWTPDVFLQEFEDAKELFTVEPEAMPGLLEAAIDGWNKCSAEISDTYHDDLIDDELLQNFDGWTLEKFNNYVANYHSYCVYKEMKVITDRCLDFFASEFSVAEVDPANQI